MSGKSIVIAVALAGWFLASLIGFAVVVLFDGVAFIGVLIAFVATQGELHSGSSVERSEGALIAQSARFFRHFGLALAVIGFGGFAYTYL